MRNLIKYPNIEPVCFLTFQGDPKDVIELTDSNFDSLVLNSEYMWLVEFYAPWCGHCKNLAPHWAQAASELKGKVRRINGTIVFEKAVVIQLYIPLHQEVFYEAKVRLCCIVIQPYALYCAVCFGSCCHHQL